MRACAWLGGPCRWIVRLAAPFGLGLGLWTSVVDAAPVGQFGYDDVVAMARRSAARPYADTSPALPAWLSGLGYDQYRDIHFRTSQAIWHNTGSQFELQLFHRARYVAGRVDLHVVDDGKLINVPYSPDFFAFGPAIQPPPRAKTPPPSGKDLGYSGFRIHAPINRADYFDEFAVFQGASYFRGIARGEAYGLSARGLALKTADPSGEEFPFFKSFWIEKPDANSGVIKIDALLDSKSVAGAYRFTIRPGTATIMDVHATLFPRIALDRVGIAPMSSMFYFAPYDRAGVDDFRPSVHDSDGLQMYSGAGEWIWRPLANPSQLQVSAFVDRNPKGFGLMQRARRFDDYQDLEADYEKRPSLWVEPRGAWGDGNIILVEIPTDSEVHDNIVAFWRPKAALPPGRASVIDYRLTWSNLAPLRPSLAQVISTELGRDGNGRERLVVIDFGAEPFGANADAEPKASVTSSAGAIADVVVQPNEHTGGWRLSFHFDPGSANLTELRALLIRQGAPVSETWLYRWTR